MLAPSFLLLFNSRRANSNDPNQTAQRGRRSTGHLFGSQSPRPHLQMKTKRAMHMKDPNHMLALLDFSFSFLCLYRIQICRESSVLFLLHPGHYITNEALQHFHTQGKRGIPHHTTKMAVAVSRLLCPSRPLKFDSSSSSSSARSVDVSGSTFQRTVEMKKNKKVVVTKCSLSENVILERETKGGVRGLGSVAADVAKAALGLIKPRVNRKSWPVQAEIILETGILNCRFFTLFAVAGSLIGSILCFLEGCFVILESFYQYFHNMSQRSDQGEVMHLLVEALDFFLVGNAMLIFGVGIYVMFVGSKEMNRNKGSLIPGSNLFGFFHLKRLPSWVDMQSLSQAKAGIGHSVVMILQAGVIDKLKDVPMTSVLDLACLAGTILLSSACIFLLSRLSNNNNKST